MMEMDTETGQSQGIKKCTQLGEFWSACGSRLAILLGPQVKFTICLRI